MYLVAAILKNEKTLGTRLNLNERASRASLIFGSSLIIIIIIIIIIIMIIIITIISNGNRTEWSPIRSVIIRVINKRGSPICLISSMITDRIGRHEVLLLINHNFEKICAILGSFFNQNTRNSEIFFASRHLSACVMARTVQLLRHDAYCPI